MSATIRTAFPRARARVQERHALYHPVAVALSGYAAARFRVRILGARIGLEAGDVLVATHRADTDVPVIVAALYPRVVRGPELHFAVRDDLFARGFLAAYPRGLPRIVRGALSPVGIGPVLRRALPCHPIRGAASIFPPTAPNPIAQWRELVDVVARSPLLLFPEGRPSPDGAIGPLTPGLATLVRRARPRALRALALAYDPLCAGRPYAYVGVGARFEDEDVLTQLRRLTPLTVGQVVAVGGRLDEEIAAAEADGRPFDPGLRDPRRLAEALAAAERRPELLGRLAREYESARET